MRKIHPALSISSLLVRRSKAFHLDVPKLEIVPGSVTCVVGANGSGKTTLVETIVGLLEVDGGSIQVHNKKVDADTVRTRSLIGYVPDDDSWVIDELTAREYFALLQSVYAKAGVHGAMELELDYLAETLLFTSFDQRLGSLSHGNKKKVQLMAAMMHTPQVLVIDELRNGLDPIAIVRAEKLLKEQQENGTTILAATHDLWWAERFASNIVMIQDGHVVLNESTKQITKDSGSLEARFMELYAHA